MRLNAFRTTRGLLVTLLVNALFQLVLLGHPPLFGRAYGFLSGFTVGLAIALSIGALVIHGGETKE